MKIPLTQIGWTSLAPPPQISVSEWADRYRVLSPESSAEPGRWRTDRAPYQRGIMDAIGDDLIEIVCIMSSAQIGKTEILNNCLGRQIHVDPCPILFVQPTLEMAESFSKERFYPMIRDCSVLSTLIGDFKTRSSGNTLLHKSFVAGHLSFAGANSPSSLSSRPIRVVLLDEPDRYPKSVSGGQGDPIAKAIKRTATFFNSKVIMVSTPTIKGTGDPATEHPYASRIEKTWLESDRRKYFINCPHCGFAHPLHWDNIFYSGKETDSPNFDSIESKCPSCEQSFTESHKPQLLREGNWQATASQSRIAGFHLNELYSPWRTWGDIARDFEVARKDREQFKVWVNESQGLPYEEQVGEKLNWEKLQERALRSEYSQWEVPRDCLLLTAGVDVQGDRLEVAVWGWGKGEQAWLIGYDVILANPLTEEPWQQLEDLLLKEFSHASGAKLKVRATCIDSGNWTQDVYQQVRKRTRLRWYAVKGKDGDRPIVSRPSAQEINYQGKVIRRGIQLYIVGVDVAKLVLYSRSQNKYPGHKYLNFPKDLHSRWFEGFCSEVQVTKHKNGYPHLVWQKLPGVANEPLDTAVYAYAAAILCGLTRIRWGKEEKQLLAQVEEKEELAEETPQPKPKRKLREQRSWVNS